MNFSIQPITEQYILGYNQAVDSVARERKYLAFLEGPPLTMSQDFVRSNLKHNRPHFIALVDGKVVGWCDISGLNRPVFKHAGVLGIGVLAAYRGQGIGEALMRAAINQAWHVGYKRIELTVRENNTNAISLYEKLGFVREGLHKNAVCINGHYENHLSMALLHE